MTAENPTGPVTASLDKLRQEFDRLIEGAWSQGERAMDVIGLRRSATPAVDVVEQPERVLVMIDLPGVSPQGVELSIVGNMLTVQGEFPASVAAGTAHLSERPRGSFKRSIPLPACVNPEEITAESRQGVLQVTVGKSASSKARKIVIGGASAEGHS